MILVRDIMTRAPIVLTPDATAEEAGRILSQEEIGGAPVVKGGRIVGVISKADLALSPATAKVVDLMTPFIHFVRPEDPARLALTVMLSERIHRVVVIGSEGEPLGIVTTTDVARAVLRGETLGPDVPRDHADPAAALPEP